MSFFFLPTLEGEAKYILSTTYDQLLHSPVFTCQLLCLPNA